MKLKNKGKVTMALSEVVYGVVARGSHAAKSGQVETGLGPEIPGIEL